MAGTAIAFLKRTVHMLAADHFGMAFGADLYRVVLHQFGEF